jgi:hypothetical protein
VNSLLLVLALIAEPSAVAVAEPPSIASCTAARLRPFVGPMGVRQPWPVAQELPNHLASSFGELLSDQGMVADGFMQTLHVDSSAHSAYVVQQGGFAGFRTIYGPLPVAACSGPPPNNSSKPTPLRGAA